MATEPLIVFVGHDATRTGAPTSLLRIVEWFSTQTPHPCAVVLKEGGPLVEQYAELASLYVWNESAVRKPGVFTRLRSLFAPSCLTPHQQSIVSRLARHEVGAIFNNTGVNGQVLEALRPVLQAPIVSRIPELEAYMRKNDEYGSVKSVLALSDHFVAVSEAVRSNLHQRHSVPAERISVVYGACAAENLPSGTGQLRDRLGIPSDAFVVGGCGTMDWRKGADLFIQIAHSVLDEGQRDIYFCWIGGCVSKNTCIEFHYEVELLSLSGRLFLLGEVEDTAPYLADLDLFLLTSREDPFPLVMLEAARQGLPIVCFEGGGGATEFVDDTVGITVSMLDVTAMAQAVNDLRAAPERRSILGNQAYEKSLTYTIERMGKEIHAVLKTVMERGRRGKVIAA